MERWIEHLVEPARLILAWRAPDDIEQRTRWAVGELAQAGGAATFRYFAGAEFAQMNVGRSPADLKAAGFLGYPAFEWRADRGELFSAGALEAFLRRVPSPHRSDFRDYLEGFRLRPRPELVGMALLGATSAALPGDGFTLVDPLEPDVRAQDVLMEVAGYRYHAATAPLLVGDQLEVAAEPHPQDPFAVQLRKAGRLVGYVNRLQSSTVTRWLETRALQAEVVKVNGQAGHPRALMLLSVREQALAPAA